MISAPQIATLEKFRFNYPDDLATVQSAIDQNTATAGALTTVDNTYGQAATDLLAKQAALLEIKRAALAAADPDPTHVPYEIHYLAGHPSLGGSVPTAWEIRHPDPLLPPFTVDYSHAVNWDSNAALLQCEGGWSAYYDLRFNVTWGTNKRVTRMATGSSALTARLNIVQEREDASADLAVLGLTIRKRRTWAPNTTHLISRHAVVTVKSLDETITYVPGVDYLVKQDLPVAGARTYVALIDRLPDSVLVTA